MSTLSKQQPAGLGFPLLLKEGLDSTYLTTSGTCSDTFEEYVGQLQMATLVSIQADQGGGQEMSRKELTDRLRPAQQVRDEG